MEIKFTGNGNAFSKMHNNAFFESGKDIVFIDMSLLNVERAMSLHPENYDRVYLFITHMHDDHISGVGNFIFRMYFIYHKKIKVVIPKLIFNDFIDFGRLTGVSNAYYELEEAEEIRNEFFKGEVIKVEHCPELIDKCFGYVFIINDKRIVYSGDACNINDFKFALRNADEFYCDTATIPSVKVHMQFNKVFDALLSYSEKGVEIYLMHIDNLDLVEEMIEFTKFKIAYVPFDYE